MKLLGSFLLSLLCGMAALMDNKVLQLDPPPGPSLVAPESLKTNKSGRVRFKVQTNCKSVVYLVDDEKCDMAREFTDPSTFQYHFSADSPGVFRVVFVAAQGDVPVITQTVITYDGSPAPAPGPGPVPPAPGPGPNPAPPGPVTRLFVVVIEDTLQSKANRGAYYSDAKLLARIKGKGWQLRVEDKGVLNAAGVTPADLVPYIKASAGKEPYVFLVNQDGKVLSEGPLPSSPSDLLALIQKVGG